MIKNSFIIMWWLGLIFCGVSLYNQQSTYFMISNIYMWIGFLGQKLYK